ncbi:MULTISPECIES: L-rhamnose mutarotase [Saccharibacillus]|uniref:L-rhamnose mutarotase n=1 Tax=Saccharibacillus TaxID=456492 RepID=UPI0012385281|nr:L-rhamnose mutarotase [Saccharibacillus sp. WB 17]MWJ32562.1 L-rhamnose mutarotase [Saccharibacillus sp. WB 17]
MIRKASVMTVFREHHDEYRRRHDELWPEMEVMLREHGMLSYSIFLDAETDRLFAYLEIEDEERWARLADTDVCRRWWAYMRDIMETNPDDSPVSRELKPVFHLSH